MAPEQRTNFLCIFQLFPSRLYSLNSSPLQLLVITATPRLSAFRCPPSKAGRDVAFFKLARAKRRRWLVLREFAKYAFCGLKRKHRNFERSVLKNVSIKIPVLTHSGHKSRVCVNALDRLTTNHRSKMIPRFFFFSRLTHAAARQSPHVKRGQHLRAGLFQRGCLRKA